MPLTNVGRSEDLLAELSAWVKQETPTTDGNAVNRLMDVAEGELSRAGAAITAHPRPRWFRRQPDRPHARGWRTDPDRRSPGHGLVARHAGPDAVRGERAKSAWPWHLRHEGGQLPGLPRRPLHPSARHCDASSDRAAADAGRGSGQPHQPLADRAGSRPGRRRADPRTRRGRRRVRHRAQGCRPLQPCGSRAVAPMPAPASRTARPRSSSCPTRSSACTGWSILSVASP